MKPLNVASPARVARHLAAAAVLTLAPWCLAPASAADAASSPAPAASGPATADLPAAAPEAPMARSKKDPFEGWNRGVFSFNEAVDTAVLKPVAQAYRNVVPEYVRGLVDNVFGNIADAWSVVNHFLQGKIESGLTMGMRVVTNSVLGFGGLLDIGTEIGLERQSEDFGQTLGRWGLAPGPYLVLPILGPSTVRDTVGLAADLQVAPATFIDDTRATQLSVTLLQAVSTRAGLLGASKVLDDVALDKYSFLRDAYLARRRNQVYDGNPPEEPEEDEGEPAK